MSRKTLTVALLTVAFGFLVLPGCDSKTDSKQPQLQGPPDPKIKGPAAPGAGGGNSTPAPAPVK